jgi:hypothetical protein
MAPMKAKQRLMWGVDTIFIFWVFFINLTTHYIDREINEADPL